MLGWSYPTAVISTKLSLEMYDATTSALVGWMMGGSIPTVLSVKLRMDASDSTTNELVNWINGTAYPVTLSASITLSAIGESSVFNWMAYYLQQILAAETAFNHQYGVSGYAEGGIASGPESGYMAKLHGTELVVSQRNAVPVRMSGSADGYNDPETKALLRQLVAQGNRNQNAVIVLEDGTKLNAVIRREADVVRREANERKGTARRKLYS